MYYKTYYESSIGRLTLYALEEELIEIRFPKERHPSKIKEEEVICDNEKEVFVKTRKWLDAYFNGEKPEINLLPYKMIGTSFQKQVWKLLCEIPYGEVVTYKDIALKISPTMSSQAVGVAVGYNPLCILVPCHRVIGTKKNLVGFGGGLDTKKWLLKHEGIDITKYKTPTKGNAL